MTDFETTQRQFLRPIDPFPPVSRDSGWSGLLPIYNAIIINCISLIHIGYVIKERESDNFLYMYSPSS